MASFSVISNTAAKHRDQQDPHTAELVPAEEFLIEPESEDA